MRNPFPRSSLLIALLCMAVTLLGSNILSAEPAGAASVSRRPAPVVRSSSKARRPAVRRVRPRYTRTRFPRPSRSGVRVPTGDVWAKLRACESGGRYNINTGNGFYGAYQFHPRTWRGLGYPGLPHQAPPEMQDEAARKLQSRSGWGQWPVCSRRIGAR
jgi:transglycosylase-like protein